MSNDEHKCGEFHLYDPQAPSESRVYSYKKATQYQPPDVSARSKAPFLTIISHPGWLVIALFQWRFSP